MNKTPEQLADEIEHAVLRMSVLSLTTLHPLPLVLARVQQMRPTICRMAAFILTGKKEEQQQ